MSIALATLGCLAWLVPTAACYRARSGLGDAWLYFRNASTQVSVLASGVNYRSLANVSRFFVPLACATWPLAWPIGRSLTRFREKQVALLWLWIAPGAAYLVLCRMADAPYLNFLTPALVLLAMIVMDRSRPVWRMCIFAAGIAWNVGFFMLFRPLPTRSVAVDVVNVFCGKYTAYAIRNHWQPDLSSLHDRTAPFER